MGTKDCTAPLATAASVESMFPSLTPAPGVVSSNTGTSEVLVPLPVAVAVPLLPATTPSGKPSLEFVLP
jgi:hypothetical protein